MRIVITKTGILLAIGLFVVGCRGKIAEVGLRSLVGGVGDDIARGAITYSDDIARGAITYSDDIARGAITYSDDAFNIGRNSSDGLGSIRYSRPYTSSGKYVDDLYLRTSRSYTEIEEHYFAAIKEDCKTYAERGGISFPLPKAKPTLEGSFTPDPLEWGGALKYKNIKVEIKGKHIIAGKVASDYIGCDEESDTASLGSTPVDSIQDTSTSLP